jgi:hypothetical protein
MNKKTLNIIAVCVVSLVIVFSITYKDKINLSNSSNIAVDENGKILTKADQYQASILETVTQENIKNLQEFSKTFEKNSQDNLTDGLSKDIFSQYIKYNTAGEIKQEDVLSAAQEVLKKDTSIKNPAIYTDIKTLAATKTNLRIYGNNMAVIQNGIVTGIQSLNNKKDKTPYISSIYLKVADIMIVTPVPESLSNNHINLINGFKKYSEGLSMMNEQYTDPAKALLGLKKVKEATDEITVSLNTIVKTIDLNDIIYAPTEPGFLLNKIN